jgi:hypothetical protein
MAFQITEMFSWQVLGPHLTPYGDAAPIFETHERLDDVSPDN